MGLMKFGFVRVSVLFTIFFFIFLTIASAQEAPQSARSPEAMAAYRAYVTAEKEGDIALAIQNAQMMLILDEKSLGKDRPEVAVDLSNLARLYFQQGAYAKAEPLYLRALAISEAALGPDHPQTGVPGLPSSL